MLRWLLDADIEDLEPVGAFRAYSDPAGLLVHVTKP